MLILSAGDIMKKIILVLTLILTLVCLCSCGNSGENITPSTTTTSSTESATQKYENSKFLGKWYNAYSVSEVADFELLADGTAIHSGETKGTWSENGEEIVIDMTIDGEARKMKGYFIIAGDGFSCRATPENQHYIDDGEGELQLEIMLTETTCIDCVQK